MPTWFDIDLENEFCVWWLVRLDTQNTVPVAPLHTMVPLTPGMKTCSHYPPKNISGRNRCWVSCDTWQSFIKVSLLLRSSFTRDSTSVFLLLLVGFKIKNRELRQKQWNKNKNLMFTAEQLHSNDNPHWKALTLDHSVDGQQLYQAAVAATKPLCPFPVIGTRTRRRKSCQNHHSFLLVSMIYQRQHNTAAATDHTTTIKIWTKTHLCKLMFIHLC